MQICKVRNMKTVFAVLATIASVNYYAYAQSQVCTSAEKVVPRSSPGADGRPKDSAYRTVTVYVPLSANIQSIKAFMKNEPWGGAQSPAKPNTDDLGSIDYKECPIDRDECPISWSHVRDLKRGSSPTAQSVSARFANWAHRNDRTAKLEVCYQR